MVIGYDWGVSREGCVGRAESWAREESGEEEIGEVERGEAVGAKRGCEGKIGGREGVMEGDEAVEGRGEVGVNAEEGLVVSVAVGVSVAVVGGGEDMGESLTGVGEDRRRGDWRGDWKGLGRK